MTLVKWIKGMAIGFALTVGLTQSASAAWNPLVVSVAQVQLEMESCGLIDGEKDKFYSRCIAISHPKYHRGNPTRWYARGTLCKALVDQYSAPFWYREDIFQHTQEELAADASCIPNAFEESLESIRADACGAGTKLNAAGTQCVVSAATCGAGTELNAAGTQCVVVPPEEQEFCACNMATGKLDGTCTDNQKVMDGHCAYIYHYGSSPNFAKTAFDNAQIMIRHYGVVMGSPTSTCECSLSDGLLHGCDSSSDGAGLCGYIHAVLNKPNYAGAALQNIKTLNEMGIPVVE